MGFAMVTHHPIGWAFRDPKMVKPITIFARGILRVYPFWVSKKNDETMIFIPQANPFKPLIIKYFDRDPVGYAMIKTAGNAVLSWSNLNVTPILRSLWSLQYLLKTPPSTGMGN